MSAIDRELDALEQELEDIRNDPDLYADEKAVRTREIHQAIREIERDASDEERWREEGAERGWR